MIDIKRINVTPEIATEMLSRNTSNYRKVSRDTVAKYAADMKAGRWKDNGETIVFDEDGCLKNGQHRLSAVKLSGCTIPMTIVYGVERGINVYDQQSKRSVWQYLAAEGLPGSLRITAITGAVRTLITGGFQRSHTSNTAVCEGILADAETWEAVASVCEEKRNAVMCATRSTGFALAAYIALKTNVCGIQDLIDFARVANTGIPTKIHESTPALVLRNMAIRNKGKTGWENARLYFAASYQAISDFVHDIPRTRGYSLTKEVTELFDSFRKEWRDLYMEENK